MSSIHADSTGHLFAKAVHRVVLTIPICTRNIREPSFTNAITHSERCSANDSSASSLHFGKSPEELGFEHVRKYLVYLIQECGLSRGTYTVQLAALRHLYHVTLGRPGQLDALL